MRVVAGLVVCLALEPLVIAGAGAVVAVALAYLTFSMLLTFQPGRLVSLFRLLVGPAELAVLNHLEQADPLAQTPHSEHLCSGVVVEEEGFLVA